MNRLKCSPKRNVSVWFIFGRERLVAIFLLSEMSNVKRIFLFNFSERQAIVTRVGWILITISEGYQNHGGGGAVTAKGRRKVIWMCVCGRKRFCKLKNRNRISQDERWRINSDCSVPVQRSAHKSSFSQNARHSSVLKRRRQCERCTVFMSPSACDETKDRSVLNEFL